MSVATYRASPTVEDFSRVPFAYVPLSESGSLIRNLKVTIEYSYLKAKEPANALDRMILNVMDVFNCFCHCPRRYVTSYDRIEVELSPIGAAAEYDREIDRLRRRNPTNFEILQTNYSEQELPLIFNSEELIRKIETVLNRNEMRCSKEHLSQLLTARDQALVFQKEIPSHVVCVSSKSPYFSNINDSHRAHNKKEDQREAGGQNSTFCTASVRVFPNRACSLTIPGLERWRGGTKVVSCDIYMDSEGNVRLMRRNKLRDDRRYPRLKTSYENSIQMVSRIENPHVLSPKVIFSHPKGIQFFTDNYPKDVFIYLTPYYYFQYDIPSVSHILTTPIETQVCQAIEYMIGIARGLKALNEEGLLHNDTKPENILIDTTKSVLFDFDYACTLSDGRAINRSWGAKEYTPKNIKFKNESTEFYSLALNYWMNLETRTTERPSFMNVFTALRNLCVLRKQHSLLIKIDTLIASLRGLCQEMKKGVTSQTGPTLTYDDVLSALNSMAAPFNPSRGSAATRPLI